MAFSCDLPNRPATVSVRVRWQRHSHSTDERDVDLHGPARDKSAQKEPSTAESRSNGVEETELMSAFAEGSPPDWFQDIANALASSRKPHRSGGYRLSWRRSRPRLCGWLLLNPQNRPARFWLRLRPADRRCSTTPAARFPTMLWTD